MEPWAIHAYTTTDMAKTLSAFRRFVDAIGSQIESNDASTYTNMPWHDPVTSTQNFIPPSSFAHGFLSAASHYEVCFRYIAPGICLPTVLELLGQVMTDFADSPYTYMGGVPGRLSAAELHNRRRGARLGLSMPPYACRTLNRTRCCEASTGCLDGFMFRHYVQIHKMLENWAERVEDGDWEVNRGGEVQGGGYGGALRKYWTPRSFDSCQSLPPSLRVPRHPPIRDQPADLFAYQRAHNHSQKL
ncbi:hypothetical protein BDW68DRAFT_183486 [Aspergillus falconensis]